MRLWSSLTIGGIIVNICGLSYLGSYTFAHKVYLSTVATGGVGAFYWLMVYYLVGYVMHRVMEEMFVLAVAHGLVKVADTTAEVEKNIVNTSITSYIRSARDHGMLEDQIRADLLAAGWAEEDFLKYLVSAKWDLA